MHETSSRAEELWNFLSLLSSHLRDLLPNNCWILHFFTLKIFTFSLHILSIWMCSIYSMSRNIYKLLALRNAASQFVGPNMRHIYILSCINRYGPTPNSKNESPVSALHFFSGGSIEIAEGSLSIKQCEYPLVFILYALFTWYWSLSIY